MILSVSRRTDIPAFYLEWFFNRIQEGYVLVRNPMNYHQVSKIDLSPDVIDCMVFWTKNPSRIIEKLALLKDYRYYFQVSINPYNQEIERNVPKKAEVIKSFKKLSRTIGKHKSIWRYDPVILTERLDKEYHYKYFEYIASQLSGYTEKCIFSFLEPYKKTQRNMNTIKYKSLEDFEKIGFASGLSKIASKYNISLEACSIDIDLSPYNIKRAKCIDYNLISEILGEDIIIKKDKNQRALCGCSESIDIGTYNTCNHGCLYCYANFSDNIVNNNIEKHNPNSPFLYGDFESEDKIKNRDMKTYRSSQIRFL
ncbi:hypothetical protein J2Z35_002567 [Acetoanaerobium pronyense]|uniref:DUF1848 domain-containing protein n=1 Tax=Acetoanaerobium pronyense TaxID=1482736 RepID=A0ABS4KLS4_9FIRM|nr:hypothetical protein [Acetoanaerobium pronyense]